jgi:hypothetical protein
MSRVFGVLVVIALACWAWSLPASAQSPCRFVLGFADLRTAIGASTMGDCLEDEQHNPENGDGIQRTSKGLAVWRKASNTMAFTDGGSTWVNGPNGVQKRANNYRFRWEPDGPMLNGGRGADPNEAVEMTPDIVRATNANRQAAGLPPLDIGVTAAPPPAGSGDAATATAVSRSSSPSAALATATPTQRTVAIETPASTSTSMPRLAATSAPASSSGGKNCSDYKSQADAQAELRAHPDDRYGLDTDKDGIACESRPAPKDTKKVPR